MLLIQWVNKCDRKLALKLLGMDSIIVCNIGIVKKSRFRYLNRQYENTNASSPSPQKFYGENVVMLRQRVCLSLYSSFFVFIWHIVSGSSSLSFRLGLFAYISVLLALVRLHHILLL